MSELFLSIDWDTISDTYWYYGNVKEDKIIDFVSNYLRSKIGSGEDVRDAEENNLYQITIYLDLSRDHFSAGSNCNNYGLREGIIIDFMHRLRDRRDK